MILRRPVRATDIHVDDDKNAARPAAGAGRRTPLRWQLVGVTATTVAIAVTMMTIAAYWIVSTSLARSVDESLENKASILLEMAYGPSFLWHPQEKIDEFHQYYPDIRVAYYQKNSLVPIGDPINILDEVNVLQGTADMTARDFGDERILAKRNSSGVTVILAQNMTGTHELIRSLGMLLLFIGALGVLVAIAAGIVVATAALRPVNRLRRAADYVARTDDLTPIEVVGNDEIAQLTKSFNSMLEALAASRRRQTELVADAGHELKTPLTSLRTNVELLMMVSANPHSAISPEDRKDLEHDVIAQIEELSQLIGDLVDLAREDGQQPQTVLDELDLVDCMESSLERVRRRRSDVEFRLRTEPWYLYGDGFALGRAMLNLMDNAAKWSPPEGVVRIEMTRIALDQMEITFSDSGPGIPVEDRKKVFERFYRSIQARSMTGSGLGLAIVAKVVDRHCGTITAEESDDGGCMMRVVLPGAPEPGQVSGDECIRAKNAT